MLEVNGKILSETGFIVHYLMTHYPHALEGTPSDSSVFWSFFSEGSLMLHLQPGRIVGMAASVLPNKPGTTPEQGQGITTMANWLRNGWVKKNVTIQLGEIEEFLTKSPNFSGTDTLGQGDVSGSQNPTNPRS